MSFVSSRCFKLVFDFILHVHLSLGGVAFDVAFASHCQACCYDYSSCMVIVLFFLLLFHLLVIHQSVQHISICEQRVHNEHVVEACVIDEANGTSISSKIFAIRISSFFWHLYSGLRSQGCSLRHRGICISQTKIIEEFIVLNISILIFCN